VHSIAADLEYTECKDSKGACVHSIAADLECTECKDSKGACVHSTAATQTLTAKSAKIAKAEPRGACVHSIAATQTLTAKSAKTRDEESVCCTQCSNADLECTECKGGEHASI